MGDELVVDASAREVAGPAGDDAGEPVPDGTVKTLDADGQEADGDVRWHAEDGRPIAIVPYPTQPATPPDGDDQPRPPTHPRRDLV